MTTKQKGLLEKLMLSSTFSDAEAQATARWMDSPKATISAASILIDRALARIAARDEKRKAAEERQEPIRIRAEVLRRKADGFEASAARAALKGYAEKADRFYARAIELYASASAHERMLAQAA